MRYVLLVVVALVVSGCREGSDADAIDADSDAELDADADGPSGIGGPCYLLSDCQPGLFCGASGTCYDPDPPDADSWTVRRFLSQAWA